MFTVFIILSVGKSANLDFRLKKILKKLKKRILNRIFQQNAPRFLPKKRKKFFPFLLKREDKIIRIINLISKPQILKVCGFFICRFHLDSSFSVYFATKKMHFLRLFFFFCTDSFLTHVLSTPQFPLGYKIL